MGIKFNCSNRSCRQRIEVDDSRANGSVICPACATQLQVPASHDIHFACTNPACGQHFVVDVSEAGRVMKCSACGRILRVPGDPPKPLFAPPESGVATTAATATHSLPFWFRLTGLQRLLLGWSAGTMLVAIVLLGFYLREQKLLPPRFSQMAGEIYSAPQSNLAGAKFSRFVEPVERTGTNESGQGFIYYIVPPARLLPNQKYPVLVDMTSSLRKRHARDIQFLANAGIFYVSPNSLAISNWGVTPEPQNTRAVYADLLNHPNVDPKRIYICGQSITTVVACAMVGEDPARWRGVILIEPVQYPKIPERARGFPSVFISQGLADRYNEGGGIGPGKSERFLLEACQRFVPARIDYQPGGHGYQDEQLKVAYMAAVKFIWTDY